MKRKILSVLIAISTLFICMFTLTACGYVKFKVNFVVDGEIYATIDTSGEEIIQMPENPKKENYSFDGWFWDNGTWQKPFTANSLLDAPLSSDMNVYCKWRTNDTLDTIIFNTLNVNGENVYGKVSNDTSTFSFINEIIEEGNASYKVYKEITCETEIVSKTISLDIGDNIVYILQTVGKDIKLYTVTVRRRPIYTVSFVTGGGETVSNQTVEEDYYATEPLTSRDGYKFDGWDYDFNTPITQNTEITARWQADEDTLYKVEYYLQNIDDNNYSLSEEFSYETFGITATTATITPIDIEHFTFNANYAGNILSGNIDGKGTLVLKLYYTRNEYAVKTNRNNVKAGVITSGGTYKYNKEITLTATTKDGYTFLGWFDDETKVCESEVCTFNVGKPIVLIATWQADEDTPYKVEYYLQNIDDDNYTISEEYSYENSGITDTMATTTPIDIEHFAFNSSKSELSGNIDGKGSLVLKLYYTRNKYLVTAGSNGNVSGGGSYKYGKAIVVTANPYLGCEFVGWYFGDKLLSTELSYTFTIIHKVTAQFTAKTEMSNFNFSSSSTACKIIGIKDNAVTEIIIPDYITSISSGVFENCRSLKKVNFLGTIDKWVEIDFGDYAANPLYYAKNLYLSDTLVIEANITTAARVSNYAFKNCTSLINVKIGDGVKSIGASAFSGCSSLQSITLPFVGAKAGVTASDTYQYPFGYIFGTSSYTGSTATKQNYYGSSTNSTTYSTYYIPTSLTSVTITGGNILHGAFEYCGSLTNVVIGDSVTSIGSSAFSGCSSLQSITIPFVGAKAGVTENDTYQYPFGYMFGTSSYTGSYDVKQYYYGSSTSSTTYSTYYIPTSLTSVTITGGNILHGAFRYCSSLTNVVIDDGVASIGTSAFEECSALTSVVIGDGVTSIGNQAFWECGSLLSVVIGNSVKSIKAYAFYKCSSLTSVIVGKGVKDIDFYAFYNCANLKSIKYRGTEYQWSAIEKDDKWNYCTDSYTITYNYTGE